MTIFAAVFESELCDFGGVNAGFNVFNNAFNLEKVV